MADAIAVLVAGSGATTEKEVFDLTEDFFTEATEAQAEIDLLVPVTKPLFTDSVQNVVAWYDDDKHVVPIRVGDTNLSRASSKLGDGNPETVEDFKDVFADGFDGYDKVIFIIALPEPDAEDYDDHVDWVEAALENNIPVYNLTKGLDTVTLDDEPAPEPEPEPEPEKPTRARRSRAKAVPEPDQPQGEPDPAVGLSRAEKRALDLQEQVAEARKDVPAWEDKPVADEITKARDALKAAWAYLDALETSFALFAGKDTKDEGPLAQQVREAAEALESYVGGGAPGESSGDVSGAETEAEAPKRGRGRPRTQFEVKQIWDEDKEDWVARPKGRMRKGTQWRTIHAETDEVLEEGTA